MKHPAAQDALRYIKSRPRATTSKWMEEFSLCRNDEVSNRCYRTLSRINMNAEVDDIDILGLAYVMKQGECG